MTPRTAAIFIFNGVEPLDCVGPFEAFISAETNDGDSLFETGMMGETMAPVSGAGGLLKGRKATTHWATYDWLRQIEPSADIQEGARWADNGRIICSSGVSAGIDMMLHVIERLHGETVAAQAARAMAYEYRPARQA